MKMMMKPHEHLLLVEFFLSSRRVSNSFFECLDEPPSTLFSFCPSQKQKRRRVRGTRVVCKRQRRTRVAIVFGVCSLPGTQPNAVVALRDHTGEEIKRAKRVNRAQDKRRRVQHRGSGTLLLPYYLNDYRITHPAIPSSIMQCDIKVVL